MIFWEGDDLTSKFNCVLKVVGGSVEGLKSQKLFLFGQSIDNLKLCNISKNQTPRSIKRGDIKLFLILDLEKELFLLVYRLNKVHRCAGGRRFDFSTSLNRLRAPQILGFSFGFYFIFWMCSSHKLLPN